MRELRWHRLWFALGIGLAGVILVGSLVPDPGRYLPMPLWDKLQHAIAYAALAAWFGCVVRPERFGRLGLCLIAFGVLIEILQGFTGYRQFDLVDMIADILGVAAGLAATATPLGEALTRFERRILTSP